MCVCVCVCVYTRVCLTESSDADAGHPSHCWCRTGMLVRSETFRFTCTQKRKVGKITIRFVCIEGQGRKWVGTQRQLEICHHVVYTWLTPHLHWVWRTPQHSVQYCPMLQFSIHVHPNVLVLKTRRPSACLKTMNKYTYKMTKIVYIGAWHLYKIAK